MAHHISKTNDLLASLFTASTQHALRLAIYVVGTALILYLLAQIIWQIIPEPEAPRIVSDTQSTQKQPARSTQNSSISTLLAQNIFGVRDAQPTVIEQSISDAPETKLNLTLHGVVASTLQDGGAAIISRGNQQATYGIDDKIEGTRATLHKVFADRVIISNRGVKETLMLDGVDFVKASEAQVIQAKPQPVKAKISAELDPNMVADLRNNPTKFADFIAINPARENGQVVGYRVSPGQQPEFFARAGLKAGDVIVAINGLDLTLPREAMRAMQTLRQTDSLDLTILRNGSSQSLTLTLPGQ